MDGGNAVDEEEAVWLASSHLREYLGLEAEHWEQVQGVEERSLGWVVTFRHTGDFKPGDNPGLVRFYVFRDGYVEVVSKHGSRFHEYRRQRPR
jgi:hypothetical protein